MKRSLLLAVLIPVLALVPVWFIATPAHATPYPPHGVPIDVQFGICRVEFMHGNYAGYAYAQFRVTSAPGTCYSSSGTNQTQVKVVSYDVNGWHSTTCYLGNASCGPVNGVKQAIVPGGLVESTLGLFVGTTAVQWTRYPGL